jgi:hypothetical protein
MPGQLSADAPRIPRCLFPAFQPELRPDVDRQVRETESITLDGRWGAVEDSFREKGITLPTLFQAAWALTLQCYVASELICFEYQGTQRLHEADGHAYCNGKGTKKTNGVHGVNALNGVNGHQNEANGVSTMGGVHEIPGGTELQKGSMMCLFRLNNFEDLLTFLGRLEVGARSAVPFVPVGNDILLVSPAVPVDFCNTAVVYRDLFSGASGAQNIHVSAPTPRN